MDDPLGLPSLLRQLIAKVRVSWSGKCHLVIEGTPCPISALIQHEVLGIVREALTNVVKHAAATDIVLTLHYPDVSDRRIRFVIRDNGKTGQAIVIKPGHWGVRGMYERARSIGGTLQFCQERDEGTTVVFTFAPEREHRSISAL